MSLQMLQLQIPQQMKHPKIIHQLPNNLMPLKIVQIPKTCHLIKRFLQTKQQ